MTEAVAADQLRRIVQRVERLEEEKAALTVDIGEVFAEAKSHGFEPKIIRQVIARRKRDRDEQQTMDEVLRLYLDALGEPS